MPNLDIQRFALPNGEIIFLPDGIATLDPYAFFPESTAVAWSMNQKTLDSAGRLLLNIGGFAIRAGDETIIVDSGIGPEGMDMGETGKFEGGGFIASLGAAGINPEEVRTVLLTHLHPDHWGALVDAEGSPVFPNAEYLTLATEMKGDSASLGEGLTFPEVISESLRGVEENFEAAPGVRLIPAYGHTPGHSVVEVDSGEERVWILGDLLFAGAQVEYPDWRPGVDKNPEAASEMRQEMVGRMMEGNVTGAACHVYPSVFGQVLGTGKGRIWHSINV